MVEHLIEALTTHEPGAFTIDRIREGHVICRDCLGNRSGRTTNMEKPAGHLLTGSDLSKGAVDRLGHVDLKGLLIGQPIKVRTHGPFLQKPPIAAQPISAKVLK